MATSQCQITLFDDLRPRLIAPPRARPTLAEALTAVTALAAEPKANRWMVDEPLRLNAMGTLQGAQIMLGWHGQPRPNRDRLVIVGRGVGARLVLEWLAERGSLPAHVPLVILVDPCLTADELTPRGRWFNRWYATPLGGRMEPDMYQSLRRDPGRMRIEMLRPLDWKRIHVFETLSSDPEWFTMHGFPPSSQWLAENGWPVDSCTMADVLTHVGRCVRRLDKGLTVELESLAAGVA